MSGEDKSEDIDITNLDESEETLESQYFPYDPGDYFITIYFPIMTHIYLKGLKT